MAALVLIQEAMDETRLAEELLSRIDAGEFDGRLYSTILSLSEAERKQIATLAGQYAQDGMLGAVGPILRSNEEDPR